MSSVKHHVPTVLPGTLDLVLSDGSTLYELVANDGGAPVTVYLSHGVNQDLMADTGSVLDAMATGISYAATLHTMAGVVDHRHPNGLLMTVFETGGTTYSLTVEDGRGGSARVYLDKAGAEQLLLGTALMAGHL